LPKPSIADVPPPAAETDGTNAASAFQTETTVADVAGPTADDGQRPDGETPDASAPEPAEASETASEPAPWSTEVVAQKPSVSGARLSVTAAVKLPLLASQPAPLTAEKSYTLAERIAQLSPAASKRIQDKFAAAKANFPPAELALVAIKDEKVLELHARAVTGEWQFVHRYKILAASGTMGPKLRQGDNQVPEGVYGISFLNPNSKYHVALRVDYPSAFDKEMAAKDGRTALGGDIMIHGKNVSKGCLALGDEAAEELFVLAESAGLPKVKVVIAPTDLRGAAVPAAGEGQPKWVPQLYTRIASAMAPFKSPPANGLLSLLGL
jgi:L,D-transpeptidase catalytic domain